MRIRLLLALASLLLAERAPAAVIAYLVAPGSVQVGTQFDVELRADLGDPILGWGLDLGFDPTRLQIVSAPAIGTDWASVSAADGDGLAAISLSGGLTGDRRLAVVRFQALALGNTSLLLSETIADLSEGFAIDPSGFASATYQGATVNVVPEPATALLTALGLATLAVRRRPRLS